MRRVRRLYSANLPKRNAANAGSGVRAVKGKAERYHYRNQREAGVEGNRAALVTPESLQKHMKAAHVCPPGYKKPGA